MRRPHRLDPNTCRGAYVHFLTLCTHKRAPHFLDAATVDMVTSQFLHTATAESFAVSAYCLMPDHLHALIQGVGDQADLPRFVRLAKQRSGYQFTRTTGLRLWQASYFDRTLRRGESLPDVIRYILNNPVRAGLVATPAEYPFWGSGVYAREEIEDFVAVPRV